MTKEMKRPTSHISGNSIKPALSKAVEFYTDNNRQAYECIHERDEYIDYLESKLNNAKPQQALPVVPECVGEFITKIKKADNNLTFAFNSKFDECPAKYWNEAIVWRLNNPDEFALAFITGKYEVEKPQLFKLIFPNSTAVLQKDGELNSFADTAYKRYLIKNAMTEQEIKSIDERYWQFAVPVEDGE